MKDPGFYVLDGHRAFVRRWSRALGEALASGKIDTVTALQWGRPTLAPLVPYKKRIRHLSLQDPEIRDVSAVSELTSLQYLYVGGATLDGEPWREDVLEEIDFSRLEKLKTFSASLDAARFGNLQECSTITSSTLVDCGLRDLTPLSGLTRLKRLEIQEAPLRSLAGIEGLRSLEWLRIFQAPLEQLDGIRHAQRLKTACFYYLRRLKSIGDLASLPNLRVLQIDGSKKVTDLDRLGDLRQLERLVLEGVSPLPGTEFLSHLKQLKELLLLSVGELPSLDFLHGFRSLETFSMMDKTVVRDGDLSVLLELPTLKQFGSSNHPHYSPRVAEIEAALADRRGRRTRKK